MLSHALLCREIGGWTALRCVCVWMLITQQCLDRFWVWLLLIDSQMSGAQSSRSHPTSLSDVFVGNLATQALFFSFLTSSHFIPPPFPLFVCICRPSASPLTLHREQSQGSKVRLCLSLFHSLSLSRFVLSIEPLPLGPSALSVSL